MPPTSPHSPELYRKAALLALITIIYNIAEGAVSVGFGVADETLSLFGFGLDSFVEVISGVGIWHMVQRVRRGGTEDRDAFERRALRITGGAFYLLAAGLVVTAGLSIYSEHRPETTVWGIAVSLISISFMWLLIHHKTNVGRALNSPAILADAACSRTCLLLSAVLLAASAGYELTGIAWLDSLGSLAIAWLAWREGREAFGKADGMACSCSCGCSNGG
ncbi:cation transporter [Geobacter sulfurreducens]|uniref:cation transporter n=1 Tax=Geobacter sulfurreducens TaxID=35554 RepID=UPI002CB2B4C0|nr:cation transporter [Geobacter sulfurreducens]HML76791.1 cation transporter [Geobacter sulfurreducens]